MSPASVTRHEWRLLFRDRTFLAILGCLFVLLAAAFVSGRAMQHEHERVRSAAQEETHRQWLAQGPKNPHSAAHFGVYAFRPLPSLAPFEPGMHAFEGTTVYLEAHKANDLRDAPSEDASSLSRLGRPSAASLLRTLLPLVVFLLTASAFAGERERGTLKLLVAQGTSLRALFAGKALAFGIVGLAFLLLVAAVTVAGARLDARALWLFAGYALYGLAALFLGLTVSLVARTSRGAFVTLFLMWAVGVLLAPRLAASFAAAAAPMPEAMAARAELERELDPAGQPKRLADLRARTLAKYGATSERELPVDFAGLALQAEEEHGDEAFDRHRARLRASAAAEDAWLDRLSVIAPSLALERWSTALAGTDRAHAEHFADAAERHRRLLLERMNGYLTEHGSGAGFGLVAGDEVWSTVPAFAYVPPDVAFATRRSWPAFGVLAAWTAIALLGAAIAIAKSRATVAA